MMARFVAAVVVGYDYYIFLEDVEAAQKFFGAFSHRLPRCASTLDRCPAKSSALLADFHVGRHYQHQSVKITESHNRRDSHKNSILFNSVTYDF